MTEGLVSSFKDQSKYRTMSSLYFYIRNYDNNSNYLDIQYNTCEGKLEERVEEIAVLDEARLFILLWGVRIENKPCDVDASSNWDWNWYTIIVKIQFNL